MKKLQSLKNLTIFVATNFLASSLYAATPLIAIMDSGSDVRNSILAPKAKANLEDPVDGVDNDHNGYIDDYWGWNFANDNAQVFDWKHVDSFPTDIYRFYAIMANMTAGREISREDQDWFSMKRKDPIYKMQAILYGSYAHGTHVADISTRKEPVEFFVAKLIGTNIPDEWKGENIEDAPVGNLVASRDGSSDELKPFRDMLQEVQRQTGLTDSELIKTTLDLIAMQEEKNFARIIEYVNQRGARVANGSFGTGIGEAVDLATMFVRAWYQTEAGEAIDPQEPRYKVGALAQYFLRQLVSHGTANYEKAPNTLFVYAAGNDSMNNDKVSTSPADVKAPNTIAVAATVGEQDIADFSNYGVKMVEVAAPGVNIEAAAPGGEHKVIMSGTSQAAPFVTNVAGAMLVANEKLKPLELKTILMGTVDVKPFLKTKVKSGGIVNKERAVYAATLVAQGSSIDEAIEKAKQDVRTKMLSPTRRMKITGPIPFVKLPSTLNIRNFR